MINYVNIDLFNQDSVRKSLDISDGSSVNLTNADIYSESFELTEMVCAEEDLVFGSCNASCLKFTTSYLGELKGKVLTVKVVLNDDTSHPFQFGIYKVIEDSLTADKQKKEVVAYDALYDIINSNVMDWYNTILPDLTSHITLKQFRDSFFSYFGITQETITLDNDSLDVYKTVGGNTLSGADVIRAICATNGCFGKINRSGNFEYYYLKPIGTGLYPSLTLYPSTSLYPSSHKDASEIGEKGKYISAIYEDYQVSKITKLIIRDSDDEQIISVGSGDNTYIMGNNLILYEKTSAQLSTVATNILNRIKDIYYTPCQIELKGNPCYETGDGFYIELVNGTEIVSYILNRTYKGIQAQRDEYTAEGLKEREEAVNTVDSQLYQLKGKSNKLERNIDETKSIITNQIFDGTIPDPSQTTSLESQITQNATSIENKVSKTSPVGQTSFSWELTDSQMEWKANNSQIMLLNSSGLKVTGEVNARTGSIAGWEISSNEISKEYQSGNTHTKISIQSDGTIACFDRNNNDAVIWALEKNGSVQIKGSGTIDASTINIIKLNASNITSGSLNGSRISAGTIATDKLDANSLSSSDLTIGTLRSPNMFFWMAGYKYTITPMSDPDCQYGFKRTTS